MFLLRNQTCSSSIFKSKLEYSLFHFYSTRSKKRVSDDDSINYSTTTPPQTEEIKKEKIVKKPIEDKKDKIFDDSIIQQTFPSSESTTTSNNTNNNTSSTSNFSNTSSLLSSHPSLQHVVTLFSNFYNQVTGFERVMQMDSLAQREKQMMEQYDQDLASKLLRYNELKQKIITLEQEEEIWRQIAHKSEQKGVHSLEEDEKIDQVRNAKKPLKEERDFIAKTISELTEKIQLNTKHYLKFLHERESALTLALHRKNVYSIFIVLIGYIITLISFIWNRSHNSDMREELQTNLQQLQLKMDQLQSKQEIQTLEWTSQWKQWLEANSNTSSVTTPVALVPSSSEEQRFWHHFVQTWKGMLQFVIQQIRSIPFYLTSVIPTKIKQFDPTIYTILFVSIAFVVSSLLRRFK